MPTIIPTKTGLTLALSLIFLPLHHAYSAEIACEFDANSEWPWVVDRVCQSDPSSTPLIASDAETGEIPFCILYSSDPDGDGWGWENNASCKVPSLIANDEDTGGVTFCTLDSSDPDGDGWGWENNASCKAASSDTAVAVASAFPVCVNATSDSDNDGWGWENNTTCTSSPTLSTAAANATCTDNSTDRDGDGWGFENGSSCQVPATDTFTPAENKIIVLTPTPGGKGQVDSTPSAETKLPVDSTPATDGNANSIVYQQDFDSSTVGSYSGDSLNEEWGTPFWHMGFNQGRVHITEALGRGNAMRVTYPANAYGAAGASAFLTDVQFGVDLPESYTELFVSYDIKFAKGFDFVRGGKLPGLCGYDNTLSPYSGCNTGGGFPDGYDGWSARGMWREDGELENYVYHSDQESYYGDDEYWGAAAIPGQWHTIQHRVVMNDVGQANGIIEAWFDGKKVLSETDFIYRKSDDIGINLFYFSTFYGGNDSTWAPTEDQFVYFDNIQVSTESNDDLLPKGLALSDALLPDDGSETVSGGNGGGSFSALFIALLLSFRRLQARRHSRAS